MEQISFLATLSRWTVSELTRYLRQLLEADATLKDVRVQGEISNLSRPSSGHIYFTLKDPGAALRCVIWRTAAARLDLSLQDGLEVEVHGGIGVYEPQGQYQLYVDRVLPVGEGALYQEFLRLKALLEAEGLFDPARKRPLPELPRRIGIVTSPTGAALRDMLDTLRRRYPLADVILAPSPVQGAEAPAGLAAALRDLERLARPDVILLARGGGSIEDLWAFNDERVVRAVAACGCPVITGVGHETDFTLVDFAADRRAPTPTAAAELATPVTRPDLQAYLLDTTTRLAGYVTGIVGKLRSRLDTIDGQLRFHSPLRRLQTEGQRLDDLIRRGDTAQAHRLALARATIQGLKARLGALDPLSVLERGYAVVTRNGKLITSRGQVAQGDDLQVRVRDGQFGVQVNRLEEAG